MMAFQDFLRTLTAAELRHVASLDYDQGTERHFQALKDLVANDGVLRPDMGAWYPLEVIELGYYDLRPGHEREFAFCLGVLLCSSGHMHELEALVDTFALNGPQLPPELRHMLEPMLLRQIAQA